MKFKKRKNQKNKIPLIIFAFVLCSLLLISVGFSAFSSDLTIGDIMAIVRVQKDIRISGINVKSVNNATVSYTDYNVKNTSMGIELPSSDSSAIFDVSVLNIGNVEMGLFAINGLDSNLKYEIVNSSYVGSGDEYYHSYSLRDKLCDNSDFSRCKLGSTTHLLIEVSYRDSANFNPSKVFYPITLEYDFREIAKIDYDSKLLSTVVGTPVSSVIVGDSLSITFSSEHHANDLSIISGDSVLVPNYDFTVENNVLVIDEIRGDTYIGLKTVTNNGISISTHWINENKVEVIVNGKALSNSYIRIRKGDTYIATSTDQLYNKNYADNPLYYKGDNVFIEYDYLDGSCSLVGAFTVKYRDTSTTCVAINDAELIANHTKQNFVITENFRNSAVATKDISEISIFINSDSSFDNLRFYVYYGKEE